IDHTAHHNRPEARVAECVGPCHLEFAHVRLVDLSRFEIARVVGAVAVARPPLSTGGLPAARDCGEACREDDECCGIPAKTSTLGHFEAPVSRIRIQGRYHNASGPIGKSLSHLPSWAAPRIEICFAYQSDILEIPFAKVYPPSRLPVLKLTTIFARLIWKTGKASTMNLARNRYFQFGTVI